MINAEDDIGKKFMMLTILAVSESNLLPCGQKTKRVVVKLGVNPPLKRIDKS